eukprot:3090836-Amphidinium_carterae.2
MEHSTFNVEGFVASSGIHCCSYRVVEVEGTVASTAACGGRGICCIQCHTAAVTVPSSLVAITAQCAQPVEEFVASTAAECRFHRSGGGPTRQICCIHCCSYIVVEVEGFVASTAACRGALFNLCMCTQKQCTTCCTAQVEGISCIHCCSYSIVEHSLLTMLRKRKLVPLLQLLQHCKGEPGHCWKGQPGPDRLRQFTAVNSQCIAEIVISEETSQARPPALLVWIALPSGKWVSKTLRTPSQPKRRFWT